MSLKSVATALAHYTAPFRRVRGSSLGRLVVLVLGLLAMTALTIPDSAKSASGWLIGCLWFCFAYFAVEGASRLRSALQAQNAAAYLLSASGLVDLLAVLPVPIALACGVSQPTAWLFACLWILKLAQNSPSFAQLGRVFVLEAKPLASVLTLSLMILFLTSGAMYVLERDQQPVAFGTLPDALWWAVVTLTTTGYGDKIPITYLGHLLGAFVMVCGIATFGLWTGILATGFAAESRRRNFIQTWDLVSKVPFFQSLDQAAIADITHRLRRIEVPANTAIIRRGKVGDCMYFIAEGEVQVDVRPQPVHLAAGAFFGELALLGDSIRTANVVTTRPATLLILDLADFRTFMAQHPDLARVIESEARRRVSENERLRKIHELERPGRASPM